MKKITITDYLENNCMCDPNNTIKDPKRSVCGFPCQANWHWGEEIHRMHLIMNLGKKFDPDKKFI